MHSFGIADVAALQADARVLQSLLHIGQGAPAEVVKNHDLGWIVLLEQQVDGGGAHQATPTSNQDLS